MPLYLILYACNIKIKSQTVTLSHQLVYINICLCTISATHHELNR